MITRVDARLRDEAERHVFRFGCEHCQHHAPELGRCSLGFPREAHHAIDLHRVDTLELCKAFELH